MIFTILLPLFAMSQQFRLRGTIINNLTNLPIEKANLKVQNTPLGTATDARGKFGLDLKKLPVEVEITCVGYEPLTIEVSKVLAKPVEIRLKPKMYNLEGVTISEKKAVPVYEDRNYSVLDYEMMDDNLLLLVFRYQLKRSVLLLLTRLGDTLLQADLPESPPEKLYKDILGNVHYFSKKGFAYQCFYDNSLNRLMFPFRLSIDSLRMYMGNLQFKLKDRLVFQEHCADGFSTLLGFYDKEHGKKYVQRTGDQSKARNYYNDVYYFANSPRRRDDTLQAMRDFQKRSFEMFYKPASSAKIVKIGPDKVALFNFSNDTLEVRNSDLGLISKTYFDFHKEAEENFLTSIATAFSGNQWKWKRDILTDDKTNAVYTVFERHGRTKLCTIDLLTGKLAAEHELPLLFAKKIILYRGEAFFMYKEIGDDEKWKLYKTRL